MSLRRKNVRRFQRGIARTFHTETAKLFTKRNASLLPSKSVKIPTILTGRQVVDKFILRIAGTFQGRNAVRPLWKSVILSSKMNAFLFQKPFALKLQRSSVAHLLSMSARKSQ